LEAVSDLNITQYRALIKLMAVKPDSLSQSELARLLAIKANVTTQAVNALEAAGLAERSPHKSGDGRMISVHITAVGTKLIRSANKSIISKLYAIFPTRNPAYRKILEAAIAAGANIDPPLSREAVRHYFASRTLVSIEVITKVMAKALRATCGASFNECLVLLRIGEVGEPLRISALARQLKISDVNAVRSVDRLVDRGWVQRLASPLDRKAVFVAATDAGKPVQVSIRQTIATVAEEYLWSKLDEAQSRVLAEASHVVLADIEAKEKAERTVALSLLEPIEF
jgi:DNA-binding MarR family transcriptional regulator